MNDQNTTPSSLLIQELPGGIVRLILNRPERKNALDRELVLALGAALLDYGQRETTRVLILEGAGGAFCSGADLTTIVGAGAEDVAARIEEFHVMIRAIASAQAPVLAAIEGPAVGFGADLALACDMRVMSETAYLEEGFIKVGLMPDGGGTLWLEKFLGPQAFEFLALGHRLDASACERFGIANSVQPPSSLQGEAERCAQSLAQAAPLALKEIKRSLRAAQAPALEQALAREKAGQSRLIVSTDFQEGVRAFLEKRPAQFTGK